MLNITTTSLINSEWREIYLLMARDPLRFI